MNELKLADLGEGMHEAEIVEWLVQAGDLVRLDQPVVRVETDKALVEIPSPVAGRITEIRFQAGQTAKVGETLAVYNAPQGQNASANAANTPGKSTPAERIRTALAEDMPSTNGVLTAPRRVLAAPAVRKLAVALDINLAPVTPSAANGRVTLEDVRAHAAQRKNAPAGTASTEQIQAGHTPNALSQPRPVEQGTTGDVRKALTGLRRQIA